MNEGYQSRTDLACWPGSPKARSVPLLPMITQRAWQEDEVVPLHDEVV